MAEIERLNTTSEIFIINGTDLGVDLYVNFEDAPTISDPSPYKIDRTFICDGTKQRPFATYTFEVRLKRDPGGPVLAVATVPLSLGRSFSGVFHALPGKGFQLAIFENDLSVGTDARLTLRNTSTFEMLSWSLDPVGTDNNVPSDQRRGTVANGQWQIARSLVPNIYDLKIYEGSRLIAQSPRLSIGLEQNIIINVCGTQCSSVSLGKTSETLVVQEFKCVSGSSLQDTRSGVLPSFSTADTHLRTTFTCRPMTLWEAAGGDFFIRANDPDGYVNSLAVERTYPRIEGIQIDPASVQTSAELGDAAIASLSIGDDVPPGRYKVVVVANKDTMGETARCVIDLAVRAITVDRLRDQLTRFRANREIDAGFATEIEDMLAGAAGYLNVGDHASACNLVSETFAQINDAERQIVSKAAADPLRRETGLLLADLACA